MKKLIAHLISMASPSLFFTIAYIHNRRRLPHFRHPRDLSELWIRYILDGKPREMYWLADKYKVREYVAGKGLADILVPLVGGQNGISVPAGRNWRHCPTASR